MQRLTIELFVRDYSDFESRQFEILQGLSRMRRDFTHNRIYPSLAELIELYSTLTRVARSADDIRKGAPRRIRGLDLKAKRIIFESLNLNKSDMEAVEELIAWALPHIEEAIDEGRTIYNFVDEHLALEEVGIVPSYVEEGYLMVPDLRNRVLHVLRYETSIFTSSDERFRNLRTEIIETLPLGLVQQSPGSIKQQLMSRHRDMPNPATYVVSTELDFPFQETILPIAKRKFMRRLFS
jgi:hypothetical protein